MMDEEPTLLHPSPSILHYGSYALISKGQSFSVRIHHNRSAAVHFLSFFERSFSR